MKNMKSSDRICLFRCHGGPLTIRMMATNAARAGAAFNLLTSKDGRVVVDWKMAAGDTGSIDHEIETTAKDISDHCLTWEILVCSLISAVDSCVVELEILQDGATCAVTKQLRWELSDLPHCETDEVISIAGSARFLPIDLKEGSTT